MRTIFTVLSAFFGILAIVCFFSGFGPWDTLFPMLIAILSALIGIAMKDSNWTVVVSDLRDPGDPAGP